MRNIQVIGFIVMLVFPLIGQGSSAKRCEKLPKRCLFERMEGPKRYTGFYHPAAYDYCESLKYKGNRDKCLAQIKMARFSSGAVEFCRNHSTKFDNSRIDCLVSFKDLFIRSSALQLCIDMKSKVSPKECVSAVSEKEFEPLDIPDCRKIRAERGRVSCLEKRGMRLSYQELDSTE